MAADFDFTSLHVFLDSWLQLFLHKELTSHEVLNGAYSLVSEFPIHFVCTTEPFNGHLYIIGLEIYVRSKILFNFYSYKELIYADTVCLLYLCNKVKQLHSDNQCQCVAL